MIDFEWLQLPLGQVVMGTDDDLAPADERPSRTVTIGSLAVSAEPVATDAWAAFVDETGYRTVAEVEGSSFVLAGPLTDIGEPIADLDWRAGQPAGPATHIAWFDAYEFCRWGGFRLPTEAEWAYAAAAVPGVVGDLWQWCADWYSPDFYRTEQRVNPQGPNSGIERVARGGTARGTQRLAALPDLSAGDLGFRVVRRRRPGG